MRRGARGPVRLARIQRGVEMQAFGGSRSDRFRTPSEGLLTFRTFAPVALIGAHGPLLTLARRAAKVRSRPIGVLRRGSVRISVAEDRGTAFSG